MSLRDLFSPELGYSLWIFQTVEDVVVTERRSYSSVKYIFSLRIQQTCPPPSAHGASRGSVELGNNPSLSGVQKITTAHKKNNLHVGFQVVFPSPCFSFASDRMTSLFIVL